MKYLVYLLFFVSVICQSQSDSIPEVNMFPFFPNSEEGFLDRLNEFERSSSFSFEQEDDPSSIPTTVITINLSSPDINSIRNSNGRNKLVVKNRSPLAIRLINGNPFRYKYAIKYEKVNLFGTADFSIEPIKDTEAPNKFSYVAKSDNLKESEDFKKNDIIVLTPDEVLNELTLLGSELESYLLLISSTDNLDFSTFQNRRSDYKIRLEGIKKSRSYLSQETLGADSLSLKKTDQLLIIDKELQTIESKLEKILSVKANSYLIPIDINGENIDYVDITLEIYELGNNTPVSIPYKIWINGGLKIDVSGGGFITSIFDSEYITSNSNDEANTSSIIRRDLGNYDFGFGALVNISLRGGSWVRPSLNFGTLLTSNQKFQILAGGGLILGKNERWVLHGGLAMGRVNELDSNLTADGVTQYSLGSSGEVPTSEKFKFGHFFGVTYNFTKKK